jgi:hypothetical protein
MKDERRSRRRKGDSKAKDSPSPRSAAARPARGVARKAGKSKGAKAKGAAAGGSGGAESYTHPEATSALRPDVGVQAQFRKKKPPRTYRYDSSLSPSLEWDEQPAREQGEALIAGILEAGTLEEAWRTDVTH